jgi:hypothetical protein
MADGHLYAPQVVLAVVVQQSSNDEHLNTTFSCSASEAFRGGGLADPPSRWLRQPFDEAVKGRHAGRIKV